MIREMADESTKSEPAHTKRAAIHIAEATALLLRKFHRLKRTSQQEVPHPKFGAVTPTLPEVAFLPAQDLRPRRHVSGSNPWRTPPRGCWNRNLAAFRNTDRITAQQGSTFQSRQLVGVSIFFRSVKSRPKLCRIETSLVHPVPSTINETVLAARSRSSLRSAYSPGGCGSLAQSWACSVVSNSITATRL